MKIRIVMIMIAPGMTMILIILIAIILIIARNERWAIDLIVLIKNINEVVSGNIKINMYVCICYFSRYIQHT